MSMGYSVSRDKNTLEGQNASFVVLDEIHTHPDNGVQQVLKKSQIGRLEPMMLEITTAGTDTGTFALEEHLTAISIATGEDTLDSYFAMPYGLEEGDDWTDESLWVKANPSLGTHHWESVRAIDDLRDAAAKARINPREVNDFKAKHLNIWSSALEAWLDRERWDALQSKDPEPMTPEAFRGRRVWGGLDLASTKDLTAYAMVCPTVRDGVITHVDILVRHYLPRSAVEQGHKRYGDWVRAKEPGLVVTDFPATDFDRVAADIVGLEERHGFSLAAIGFDPHNAVQLSNQLSGAGYNMDQVRQGMTTMSAPSKELERLILLGGVRHAGCPILGWQVGNVMVATDHNGNIKPTRGRRERED